MNKRQWTVTHLTKDKSGNTIATLWMTSNATSLKWSNWGAHTPTSVYPSNMYSSSYIRAYGLNTGSGYVASEGATTLTKITQQETHIYAKYTMPTVKGSLTKYIVTPAQVAYQETENQNAGGIVGNKNFTLPNEAYGVPEGTIKWPTDMDYSKKNGYATWKDDYIWLPSLTETGYNESIVGLWNLSINQRSSAGNSWLRSACNTYANWGFALTASGSGLTDPFLTNTNSVRPALHLNLDMAAKSSAGADLSEPSDIVVEYTGASLTLDDVPDAQKTWFDSEN